MDASDLWGKSVWDTEPAIKTKHQDPLMRVCSIGKAGENQVLYAAIVNDLHRAAGRSGVGAVMGSKNVKAIAVRGTKGVGNISNPKEFMKVTYEKKKILAENAVTGTGLPTYGTQVLMNVIDRKNGQTDFPGCSSRQRHNVKAGEHCQQPGQREHARVSATTHGVSKCTCYRRGKWFQKLCGGNQHWL